MTSSDRTRGGETSLSTLGLRVDPDPDWAHGAIVSILVDGAELHTLLNSEYIGFDAEELLDTGALRPQVPARRIAVYRCSCGVAGCGCAAPIIELGDGVVTWSDFRDFTGVYSRPTHEGEPTGGMLVSSTVIAFAAEQYLEEIERASRDVRGRPRDDAPHVCLKHGSPKPTTA